MAGWRRRCGGVLLLGALTVVVGCSSTVAGSGAAATTLASTARSTPATTRTTPPTTTSTTASALVSEARTAAARTSATVPGYVAPTECLMTVADVSAVLGGEWSREDSRVPGGCVYASDRGAGLFVGPVDYAPDELAAALAEVRVTTCDTEPIDVPGTDGAFVCVQHGDEYDYVQGNLIDGEHFWLFQILGEDPGSDYSAEVDALVALMSTVPQ